MVFGRLVHYVPVIKERMTGAERAALSDNAALIATFSSSLIHFRVVFTCDAAMLGPCASDPCRSRGECILNWVNETYATYNCKCPGKFTGAFCEHGN